jgi:hypothetical protein
LEVLRIFKDKPSDHKIKIRLKKYRYFPEKTFLLAIDCPKKIEERGGARPS